MSDALLRDAKILAARTGRTLTAVIEDSVREAVARQHTRGRRSRRPRVVLPVIKGKGLQPGVDINDSAALLELMEGRRGPA